MSTPEFRASLTNAIRFWARGRPIYNVALPAVVVIVYLLRLPESRQATTLDLMLVFFIIAVVANVVYRAVYPVDLLARYSAYRATWLKLRWLLLALGILCAGVSSRSSSLAALLVVRRDPLRQDDGITVWSLRSRT